MNKNTSLIILTVLLNSLLFGCVPAVIGGGFAGVGKSVYQDKTLGEEINDQTVWTKIRAALMRNNIDSIIGDVNVKVSEGRVLLTGTVKSREDIVKIIRICWEQNGVKEVINELKVEGESKGGLKQYAQDTWVTTRLKSKLLFNKEVKSINYNVITIDGIVYLIGIARSQEELTIVTDAASHIGGVKEVISYVRVKKDLDEVNNESQVSSNAVDEFTKEDITENNDSEEAKKTSNKLEAKKKIDSKPSEDIFSEEDFDSF
ncbi:MAG: BON domain-containing protein [Rickettsiales bacterium]